MNEMKTIQNRSELEGWLKAYCPDRLDAFNAVWNNEKEMEKIRAGAVKLGEFINKMK